MRAAAQSLVGEKILGFDTETRPAFKKGESYPPSLIQLAADDRVYVFQLKHIKSHDPIAGILKDKKVLKAGIAVDDDIKKLNDLFSLGSSGFVELADMAHRAGIKNAGIRGLAALLFGFRISKQTKCSRWDAPTLSCEQIVYAATDAWICRELYFALNGILHGKTHT
jgi:ribonuclease D